MLFAKSLALQIKSIWNEPGEGCRLLTHAYLCLMLGLFPLVVGTRGYANITAAKYLFFVIITGCWLLLLAVLLLRQRALGERAALCFGTVHKLILLYAALCLVSAILSPYPQTAWFGFSRYEGMLTMALYMAAFMGVSLFGRFRPMYIYLLAAAAAINVLLAVLQLTGADPLGLYPNDYNYFDGNRAYSGQFLGTMGNVGLLSAFFCLCIPVFVLWFIRQEKHTFVSFLLPAAAAAAMVILLISGVAAGILALSVCCLLILFLLLRSKKARLIWLLVLLLLIILILLFLWDYQGEEGFFYELSSLLHGNANESFGSSRLGIWKGALALIPESPLTGGGPDTIGPRLDMIFTAQSQDSPVVRTTRVDNAHNDYLNIAVNTGLPSLAVYLAALIYTAVLWVKKRQYAVCLSLGAGLFAYCVQIFFSFSLCLTAPLFWIIWGLFIGETDNKKRCCQN